MPLSDPPAEDLADLYDNAPCGYVSLSADTHIVKANRTFAAWLGTPDADHTGKPFLDFLGFGGRIAFETHIVPLLRMQGFAHEIAFDLLRADGVKLPVIASAAEKRDGEGRHLFTRLTLFQSVDRRLYERDLLEARIRAEAEAKSEHEIATLREQFLAVLGHDLRNPLAALAAGTSILQQRESLSERGRHIVSEMNASIARATELTDNLLDLARSRLGGGLPLARDADEPLTPMLEQVVSEIRAVAAGRDIHSQFAIAEPIDCDRSRVAQLTSNLLANAVTHGAPDTPIEVAAKTIEGRLLLTIANRGEQISPAAQAKLFEPFFRASVRQSQNGLGLGLFIVKEIAQAHGGEIAVSSTEECTRFTFSMPLA